MCDEHAGTWTFSCWKPGCDEWVRFVEDDLGLTRPVTIKTAEGAMDELRRQGWSFQDTVVLCPTHAKAAR